MHKHAEIQIKNDKYFISIHERVYNLHPVKYTGKDHVRNAHTHTHTSRNHTPISTDFDCYIHVKIW